MSHRYERRPAAERRVAALLARAIEYGQALAQEEALDRERRAPEGGLDAARRVVAERAAAYNGEAFHMVKNALNGGEISPGMGGRFDQNRYRSGCWSLLNMIPLACGGITKRPGLEFVARAAEGAVRIHPFIFSAHEARLLEFHPRGSGCGMRVIHPDGRIVDTGLTLPYSPKEIAETDFRQSGDVIFCAHENHPPAKIMRHSDTDWRYAAIRWTPAIRPPACERIQADGTWPQGANEWMLRDYAATAIDEDGNESGPTENITIAGIPPLSQAFFISIHLRGQGAQFRVYRKHAGVYGFIGLCEPDAEGRAVFEDHNIAPDTEDTPPKARNPFDGPGNYPSLVFLHQQRLGFASSRNRPLTFWLSQSGNFESMAASLPPDDSDAIEATLAAPNASRVLWAESDRDGLAFGTADGEWLLASTQGRALTPADLSFEAQTYYGSQPGLAPLRAGSSLAFVQKGGMAVREFGYSLQQDRYTSADLSLLARHILRDNPVVSWAWQAEPHGVIWCALRDGTMAGLTYLREHDVVAWHRHETDGQVISLAALPADNGQTGLWALIRRGDGLAIERLAPFAEDGSGRHVDGAADAPFRARCVPCLEEAATQTGSTFLMVRKISAIKLRVSNSRPFRCRVLSMNARPGPLIPVPPHPAEKTGMADWAAPTLAGFRDCPRLEIIMDGPDPCTILGLSATVETGGGSGGQL